MPPYTKMENLCRKCTS